MKGKNNLFTSRQLMFQEIFIGTLIYVAVLGFFNEYTSFVYAKSFSSIFFASIVLELLTFFAFQLKSQIIVWLKDRKGTLYRVLMFFCVWLIMFLSKFVFIWSLDVLFGNYINIEGYFGILIVVSCVTITHKLAYKIFNKLGQAEQS